MTTRAGAEDNPSKFYDMFTRRLLRGQQHFQPYLGCREFPAWVEPGEGAPNPRDETRTLGLMLHDIAFGPKNEGRFFEARLERGVMRVPEWRES